MTRKSRKKKIQPIRREVDPYQSWLHALACIGNEQWEEAVQAIEIFLAQIIEPQNQGVAYQNLAHCYTSLGQYDTALQMLAKADINLPDNIDTAYNQALTLAYAGRISEAEVVFKEINTQWPREARQRDVKQSLQTVQKIKNGDLPQGAYLAEHLRAKAEDNIEVGDFELAEQKYRRVVAILPQEPEGHFGLGISLLDQDRFEEAREAMMSAHTLAPDHTGTLYDIGYIYNRLQQPQEAIPWLQKASAADSDYLAAVYQLGLAYEQLGEIEEAIGCWQAMLKKEPDNYAALEKLHEHGRSDPPQEPPPTPKNQELHRMIPIAKERMVRPRRVRNGGILLTVDPDVGFTLEDSNNAQNGTVYAGKPFEAGIIFNKDIQDLMSIVKLHLTTMNADNTRHVTIMAHYQNKPSFGYTATYNRKERIDFDSDGRFLTHLTPTFFKLKVDSALESPLGTPLQGLFIYVKNGPRQGTIVSTISHSGAL